MAVCYHEVTHLCQNKTLSFPDFESTYTNKASLGGLHGVLIATGLKHWFWCFGGVLNFWGSFGFPFFTSAGPRRAPVWMQMLSVGTTPRDFIEALVESLRSFVNGRMETNKTFHPHHHTSPYRLLSAINPSKVPSTDKEFHYGKNSKTRFRSKRLGRVDAPRFH